VSVANAVRESPSSKDGQESSTVKNGQLLRRFTRY
jgi:hypothetical protein